MSADVKEHKSILSAAEVQELDQQFNRQPTEEVLRWAWERFGDRAAIGISVTHKDRKDISIYFDKDNGLPLKTEIRLTDPANKEITVEYLYSDYKDFDGIKHPGKVTIKADGKEFTMELSELKAEETLDDSLFDKP